MYIVRRAQDSVIWVYAGVCQQKNFLNGIRPSIRPKLDLVQGPSLVHYDFLRAFHSRRKDECKIQTVIKCTHSLSQKKKSKKKKK